MKLIIFTRYDRQGASSRLRSYQYCQYLEKKGFTVSISPLFTKTYLSALYSKETRWKLVVGAYVRRFLKLFTIKEYDIVLIEKELFPFSPALFEQLLAILGVNYIVDYDDAIFHRYDNSSSKIVSYLLKNKIDRVMKSSSLILAGNNYLAQRAYDAGAENVEIFPTVVDFNRYHLANQYGSPIIIGWIGSPTNTKYLLDVYPTLKRLNEEYKVRVLAIGIEPDVLDEDVFELVEWTEATEVEDIQKFDIGIMPLPDSPWERGKCGYKIIQYMACGIPVVASPVGVNKDIVEHGVNGFLASTETDWYEFLTKLIESHELRSSMGQLGRKKVELEYNLEVSQKKLVELINRKIY